MMEFEVEHIELELTQNELDALKDGASLHKDFGTHFVTVKADEVEE